MINDLYMVQPVKQVTNVITIGAYDEFLKERDKKEYRDFSRMMKKVEKEKEETGYQRTKYGTPVSFYNKEAKIFYYN